MYGSLLSTSLLYGMSFITFSQILGRLIFRAGVFLPGMGIHALTSLVKSSTFPLWI